MATIADSAAEDVLRDLLIARLFALLATKKADPLAWLTQERAMYHISVSDPGQNPTETEQTAHLCVELLDGLFQQAAENVRHMHPVHISGNLRIERVSVQEGNAKT